MFLLLSLQYHWDWIKECTMGAFGVSIPLCTSQPKKWRASGTSLWSSLFPVTCRAAGALDSNRNPQYPSGMIPFMFPPQLKATWNPGRYSRPYKEAQVYVTVKNACPPDYDPLLAEQAGLDPASGTKPARAGSSFPVILNRMIYWKWMVEWVNNVSIHKISLLHFKDKLSFFFG